jgi:hypothetical protein
MEKECCGCKLTKSIEDFSKRNDSPIGTASHCKICIRIKSKLHYINNRQKRLLRCSTYQKSHRKLYRDNYNKNYKHNPEFKLRHNISRRILLAVSRQRIKKSNKSIKLLGCSIDDYKKYLESKFKEGMSWNNRNLWHIDHIKPCVSFDLTKPEEQLKCFNYANTQPLWIRENLEKAAKLNI